MINNVGKWITEGNCIILLDNDFNRVGSVKTTEIKEEEE